MHVEEPKPAEAPWFERSYPGTKDQVRQVREDLGPVLDGCPVADDFVLPASELVTNAVGHSRSGLPGGLFTVRVEMRENGNAPGTRLVWVRLD
jgi:serine/threonine-protein kinase RsbW